MRRAVKALFAAVVVAGVVLLFVFPVRTLIDQRDQTSTAERQLRGLTAENEQLSNTAAQLQSPAAIQQIARQQYGLVKPGEKAYGIVPPPATAGPAATGPTTTTTAPPTTTPSTTKPTTP